MQSAHPIPPIPRGESRWWFGVFLCCLLFNFWGVGVGWESKNLPGGEFRQAQTALSAYWIKADNDFSLAYPTPVVGKPWSIPMEFPLYQWTVVVTGKLTGWGLTKAGRAVSIACLYLCLPAVFLLLGRWGVAAGRRWLVLAVILTCPFYIFYGRAFLIETMALMFGLWFWVAFERAVSGRSKAWLALAILTGTGAGLVKVTTFMIYLLPTGWWAAARLWQNRQGTWRADLGWITAAVALPFAATLWWVRFADATKTLNPLGVDFTSAGLRDFNLGTNVTRFSPDLWAAKAHIVGDELSWLPLLLFCGLVVPLVARTRWREMAACTACFGAVLVIFPSLYAYHSYYYVANTVLLLVAMGLALVALAESVVSRGVLALAVGLVLGGQAWRFVDQYYPAQRNLSPGGDGLSASLRLLTNPRDVIVMLGQDWNSMTPYYAQRRAMMLRDEIAPDSERVERALAQLDGETIGALVIVGQHDGEQWLIDRAKARGLESEPLYLWRDARVFLPEARRAELLGALVEHSLHEVQIAPGVKIPQGSLSNRWVTMSETRPSQRGYFGGMQPVPVRFFATFGPNVDGSSGQLFYQAHPVTRLVFALKAGAHTLRSSLQMPVDAYREDLKESEPTDGVEVSLHALEPDGTRRLLTSRYFDPRHNPGDRGSMRPLQFTFTLPAAGEVELSFGPGPAGRDTRDWIQLGPLKID